MKPDIKSIYCETFKKKCHVWLISLGGLLFTEGKQRGSVDEAERENERRRRRGNCGQDGIDERKIKNKKQKLAN